MPVAFFGASGSATGIYGYNSTTPGSGSWNSLSGPWAAAITSLATNRTQNMIVGNFYEDVAFVPIYTTNSTTWNYAGTGISCTSGQQACSTATSNAAYRTAYTFVDPSTGTFYITTKLNKSGTPNTGSDMYSSGTSLDNPNRGYITPINQTLIGSGTQQYTMNLTYQDTTTGTTCPAPNIVVWSSSNPSVATIGLSGLATTGASTGTTTISGTCNGITMTSTTLTYVASSLGLSITGAASLTG
jgi:Bacterial Ig-like domain (group 2)